MQQEFKRRYISFTVGSKHGPRSSTWVAVVSEKDVYISNVRLGPNMHVSLHESGQWHLKGYDSDDSKKLSILTQSHRDGVPIGQYAVGLFIYVPDCSLRPASDVDRACKTDIWLVRPQYGGVLEIGVMSWNVTQVSEEWPGKAAGTQLVAAFKARNDEAIGLLVRSLPQNDLISTSVLRAIADVPKPRRITLDSPERRGLISVSTISGALGLIEFAVD